MAVGGRSGGARLRSEEDCSQREAAEPRRHSSPRRRAARGGVESELQLQSEHDDQVGLEDEEDLLDALHSDRGPVGGVAREVDVDVGEGGVAVRIVAEYTAEEVERDTRGVGGRHHLRPARWLRHLAQLLGVEAVTSEGVGER